MSRGKKKRGAPEKTRRVGVEELEDLMALFVKETSGKFGAEKVPKLDAIDRAIICQMVATYEFDLTRLMVTGFVDHWEDSAPDLDLWAHRERLASQAQAPKPIRGDSWKGHATQQRGRS